MRSDRPTLIQNRSFILLLSAYAISAFGDHLSDLGIMREMQIREGDEQTRIGALMMFCFFLPYVLLGPLAGAVADRLPRRAIMIAADVIRALIAWSIPFYIRWIDDPHSTLMVLPVMALGVFACFFNPARLALVPEVVEDRHLTRANSMLNGVAPIAAILSFVVGGQLAAAGYTTANFVCDGITFLCSAVLLLGMVVPPPARPERPSHGSVLGDIGSAFRYIKRHRNVWQLMIFTATFWAAAGIFRSVLPPVVFKWYQQDIAVLGYLQATTGAGMLLGAVILTWVGDASRPHYNIIMALVGTGLMVVLFSLTHHPWIGGLCGVGVGLFGVWIVITAYTLLQRIVPNHVRGKVFGIVDLANMAGMIGATGILADPFGVLEFRALDDQVGWILLCMGVILCVMGAMVCWHHARRSPHPAYVALAVSVNDVVSKLWYRLRRDGICTVPVDGPCIVTANHVSAPDPTLILASSPNRLFGFMIAREFYDVPVWRHLIAYLECIPVRRDGRDVAATKEAIRQLRRGKALGVFVQGRIPEPGTPLELRDGVAALAMRTGVMVVPAHISGARYHDSVLLSYLARHRIRIRYGPPVDLSEFADPRDRDQVSAATQKIWQAIQALAPTADEESLT